MQILNNLAQIMGGATSGGSQQTSVGLIFESTTLDFADQQSLDS